MSYISGILGYIHCRYVHVQFVLYAFEGLIGLLCIPQLSLVAFQKLTKQCCIHGIILSPCYRGFHV